MACSSPNIEWRSRVATASQVVDRVVLADWVAPAAAMAALAH